MTDCTVEGCGEASTVNTAASVAVEAAAVPLSEAAAVPHGEAVAVPPSEAVAVTVDPVASAPEEAAPPEEKANVVQSDEQSEVSKMDVQQAEQVRKLQLLLDRTGLHS